MNKLLTILSLCAVVALKIHARPWPVNGKTIQAELVGYDREKEVVWLQEKWKKPFRVNLFTLDKASIDYVIDNKAGLVEYKGMMISREEKEKREKRDYEIENVPYAFDSKRIHSSHDDFNKTTIYKTEIAPSVETSYGDCRISMITSRHMEKSTNHVYVTIMAEYVGKESIFVSEVTLLGANGLKYTFTDENGRCDVKDGYVMEAASSIVSDSNVSLIGDILLSGRVRVRFDYTGSSGYRVDWEMRGYQKRSCLDIINAYKRLKALSDKAKGNAAQNATQEKE